MKTAKGLLKLILLMIVGGVLGFAIATGALFGKETSAYQGILDFFVMLKQYHLLIQIVTPLLLLGVAFFMYVKASKEFQNPEPLEKKEDSIDYKLNTALTLATIAYGICFIVFGIGVSYVDSILISVIVFIASVLAVLFIELAVIALVQRIDPSKKGDPSSSDFSKHWEESLDEAEKYMLYKSAYKSFSFMKSFLLGLMVISMLGDVLFDTGKFALVLSGIGWMAHTLSFSQSARRTSGTRR